MFTITPRTRTREGVSWEDDRCTTGYEIINSDGEIIYDFADESTKDYYEELNKKEEGNIMNTTNNLTDVADDIIDIFGKLLDKFDITIPDKWREGEEDEARIFGDTYSTLELDIIERLKKEKN